MSIEFVSGDLFRNTRSANCYAHGCNCAGAMGLGVAVQFKKEYPRMYDVYHWMCKNGQFKPGDVFPWFEPNKPSVLNLATQPVPGKSAKLEYIQSTFEKIVLNRNVWDIKTLALPRIGAGLGGLDWHDVKKLMLRFFANADFHTVVYEEYVKEVM